MRLRPLHRQPVTLSGFALFNAPAVLDGGSAVPCNPKPAYAGSKNARSPAEVETCPGCVTAMKAGSGEDGCREPRQDRKVATVNGPAVSRREAWLEPSPPGSSTAPDKGACTAGFCRA